MYFSLSLSSAFALFAYTLYYYCCRHERNIESHFKIDWILNFDWCTHLTVSCSFCVQFTNRHFSLSPLSQFSPLKVIPPRNVFAVTKYIWLQRQNWSKVCAKNASKIRYPATIRRMRMWPSPAAIRNSPTKWAPSHRQSPKRNCRMRRPSKLKLLKNL